MISQVCVLMSVFVAGAVSVNICRLPADTGPCRASIPRVFFNHKTGNCEEFIYGGCLGNANNFEDETACSARCLMVKREDDICSLDADTGPCRAYFRNWFYNSTSRRCEKFVYGGCQGNANNFRTQEQCDSTCGSAYDTGCGPICTMYCEYGFETDAKGCPVCKCKSKPVNICRLPAETGPCRAYIPRVFFNHKTGSCEDFVYGGCQGNANNFKDERECSARCLMVKRAACGPICRMYCPFGFEKDEDGCDICKCREGKQFN